ncbi:MAG: transketolase [Elusimicrobia bacterium]|nr:transketolase [Elusimicrobiota bacterium]
MTADSRIDSCQALARDIRQSVVKMVHRAQSAHVGSSLSMADLLAALYGGGIIRLDPKRLDDPSRDRFILSKGHASAGLYSTLALKGFFPKEWLDSFYQNGGKLSGHVSYPGVPGIEFSSGSLGHGLSVACGMALASKKDGLTGRVFAMLSDGECDEGSIWEAALFAPHHKLDNLVVLLDYNKIQSLGHVKDVLDLEPLGKKWESFGWAVREIDGHNMSEILGALSALPFTTGRPSCVVAHTVKGKGVSFMEDKLLWHYRNPTADDVTKALAEIGGAA